MWRGFGNVAVTGVIVYVQSVAPIAAEIDADLIRRTFLEMGIFWSRMVQAVDKMHFAILGYSLGNCT